MVTPAQGDIFWMEVEGKRRPVLVVTRSRAVSILNRVIVAPLTSNVRGIQTEIPLDERHGLSRASAASFDNLHPVEKISLTKKVGTLPNARPEICRALEALADC